jgi:cobalt-zinc-cadmium efflux system membrane fusion protein
MIALALITSAVLLLPPAILAEVDPHAGHDHAEQVVFAEPSAEADHAEQASEPHADDEVDEHAGHGHGVDPNEFCSEHAMLESEDALCQAGHITDLACGNGMLVRLFDGEVAAKTGIVTKQPVAVTSATGQVFPGQVAFNRNRIAKITPLSPGVVREVHVRPGSQVKQGQVLVTVAMPDLAELMAELLSATAQAEQQQTRHEREQALYHKGITSERELQQASADYRSARSSVDKYRQQLHNFGLNKGEIDQLLQQRQPSALVQLRAPFAGTVTELTTALGEHVAPEADLVTVADLDHLWIELSVPESQIHSLSNGAAIMATFRGLPNQTFAGKLFYIGAVVDSRSRTLTALAEVANPGHRLRAGMYGDVELTSAATSGQLAISADAIQMIDDQPFVFVAQQQEDLYEVRRVVTGARKGNLIAVDGLKLSDAVVVNQGYALKSEVLKARLGASCADH